MVCSSIYCSDQCHYCTYTEDYYFRLEKTGVLLCNNSFILISYLDNQNGIDGYKSELAYPTRWWNPEGGDAHWYNGLFVQVNELKYAGHTHTDGLYTYLSADGNIVIVGIYETDINGKQN